MGGANAAVAGPLVGRADHFTARNNTIVDFNAHFKVNGHQGDFPDHGAITGNTITNTAIRTTGKWCASPQAAPTSRAIWSMAPSARATAAWCVRDNVDTSIMAAYAGSHAARDLFTGWSVASLEWAGEPLRRKAPAAASAPDLCGRARPAVAAYGAFEALAACRR